MSREIPEYVSGHNLLAGKSVLITAAAGAGIGFAAAKRAVEEGARALLRKSRLSRDLEEEGTGAGEEETTFKTPTCRVHTRVSSSSTFHRTAAMR